MNQLYALVENNTIERINIQLPTTVGNTTIPSGATDLEQFNLYPITGSEPTYDTSTQRLSGPTYSFTGTSVERVYTVEDIPQAELDAAALYLAKQARQAEVDAIKVTTTSGKEFDGNEEAQTRMARAILALNAEEQTLWVLADNTPTYVSREELQEALRLAGAEQTQIWVRPYQQ